MNVPDKVKIGPYIYTVQGVPDLSEHTALGTTRVPRTHIRYVEDQSPMMVRSTVLHEILHAAASFAGLQAEEELCEEAWVSRMEGPLLQIIRDNPRLLSYLTSADE